MRTVAIVCLGLGALGGFFLGKHVESRMPERERIAVASPLHPEPRSSDTSPPSRTAEADPAASLKSPTPNPDSMKPSAPVSTTAAPFDATPATAEASRRTLFPVTANEKVDAKQNDELNKLHKAYRASCQFDPGYTALVGNDSFSLGGANWQGGVIGYDVIDPETGRTTMTGSAGATGSSNGTAEMQMLKSNAGVSFSGIVPSGDVIVTTIFASKNARGAYLAVISIHGAATGHTAAQFYGACDVPS